MSTFVLHKKFTGTQLLQLTFDSPSSLPTVRTSLTFRVNKMAPGDNSKTVTLEEALEIIAKHRNEHPDAELTFEVKIIYLLPATTEDGKAVHLARPIGNSLPLKVPIQCNVSTDGLSNGVYNLRLLHTIKITQSNESWVEYIRSFFYSPEPLETLKLTDPLMLAYPHYTSGTSFNAKHVQNVYIVATLRECNVAPSTNELSPN